MSIDPNTTIEELAERYMENGGVPATASEHQKRDIRMAVYSGAIGVLAILRNTTDLSDEEALQIVHRLRIEGDAFIAELSVQGAMRQPRG